MSIALTGKDDLLVGEARNLLAAEGAQDVFRVGLDELLDGRGSVGGADLLVLLTREQELDKVGGWAAQLNPQKGGAPRLVLCMPRPNARASGLLLKHADAIISPAGFAVEHFVERVLGFLIMEKRVEPYHCEKLLLGATRRMREIYRDIEQYARLKETVLILGETGTGKQLVAEALHRRRFGKGEAIHIDFSAIKAEVIEAELFGTVKGGFTEATNRVGLIEEADGGMAIMDEIGELSLDMQQKLLRVVEKKQLRRVGESKDRPVDVWFVFATNRNLRAEVEGGSFRRDLFARINRIVIELPPLRERKADIPLLVEHFVEKFNGEYKTTVKVEPSALDELFCLDWHENVRDLDNVIVRAAANAGPDGIITDLLMRESLRLAGGYGGVPGQVASGVPYRSIVFRPREDKWAAVHERAEAAYFRAVIEVAKDDKEAIKLSGIGRAQFYVIKKKYSL